MWTYQNWYISNILIFCLYLVLNIYITIYYMCVCVSIHLKAILSNDWRGKGCSLHLVRSKNDTKSIYVLLIIWLWKRKWGAEKCLQIWCREDSLKVEMINTKPCNLGQTTTIFCQETQANQKSFACPEFSILRSTLNIKRQWIFQA